MADELDLIRDILDKQLLDREGRAMGRVDGLVLRLREGRPPRVARMESGAGVLASRVSPRLGRLVARHLRKTRAGAREPVSLGLDKIVRRGRDLHVDADAEECGAYAWEDWVRAVVVGRIPGAGRK